ncbi:facilitated trehalose transporter Tret1-like [Ostrinia furnacalis]|uniref:facilitated trehalose transporter Tret1-like n=1 Tax=Ostrinia furnacalis TaxID=93504 RepID=UPI00103FCF44|nr:facilitated trehalose transporter Tret1-like [Ostrinia furnacalis]
MTYAASIITKAGFSINPELQSLIVPVSMICGSVVPIDLVEKTGRKPLLIGAFSVSAVSLSCLASALLVQWSGATVPSWVLVVTIATAVFSYTAGVVPIVNIIILNDMFKFQVRGKLIGLIHMFIWNCTFLQVIFFELILSALGLYSVFFMSASVNVLGALLVFFLIPETKGKTTEEIEDILAGNKSATPETAFFFQKPIGR